ncbi:hypothetical protein Tco_0943625 [Tanacetum coccineum]
MTTLSEPSPQGTDSGSRPRRQDTTMGDAVAQTSDKERLEQDDLTDFIPPTPYDSPLSGGHTPGSDEGRPNINELMAICTNLSNRVLALEQSKTAQDLVIQKLKKKVKRLEKKQRARNPGMKLYKIGISKRKSLDKEYASKQGRKSDKTKPMFDDSDFAKLDVDNAMENVEGDAETQGRNTAEQITTAGDTINTASIDVSADGPSNVSTADPSTSIAGDILKNEMMTILLIHLWLLGAQDQEQPQQIKAKKIALYEKEQREREVQEEVSNVVLREEFDNVQARLDADALLAARLQEEESEQFSINEQARFLVETIAAR